MKLSKVNSSRGAPMGRPEHHAHGCEGIVFELEWVPLVDGAYDVGGAYFGSPDNLYCAVGMLDGEEMAQHFLRADSREAAAADLLEDYPGCTIAPENGSLIKQTLEFLEDCLSAETEADCIAGIETEIYALQDQLQDKGLA